MCCFFAGLSSSESISPLPSSCPCLEVLDLSGNPLPGETPVLTCLFGLSSLRVLYILRTPLVRMDNVRRMLVSRLSKLSYLDDGPVDEIDRRGAEAWTLGG